MDFNVFNATNHLRASRTYKKKNHPLPVLSVVDDGILRGYVPFDKDWTGFSAEEYREASESVMQEEQHNPVEVINRLDLTGYEVVRAQYFATLQNPAMTISNGRLRFNTACLKKFEDVEYVELLLNSVDRSQSRGWSAFKFRMRCQSKTAECWTKREAPRLPCVGKKVPQRKTIPPRKKKPTVEQCEGRVAKQGRSCH